ncbi:MAG: hypothetical protein ABI693_20025 [Bryobacteraceae bacterium]
MPKIHAAFAFSVNRTWQSPKRGWNASAIFVIQRLTSRPPVWENRKNTLKQVTLPKASRHSMLQDGIT